MLGVRHRLHDIGFVGFEETAILLLRAVGAACRTAVVMILTRSAASDLSGSCDLDLLREGLLGFLLHGNALVGYCRPIVLLRCDDHMESGRESFYVFFDSIRDSNRFEEILQGHAGFFRCRLLSAAQQDLRFHLVSLGQELLRLRPLELEIVAVGAKTDADSLGLDLLLFGGLLTHLLGLLILELSVVQDTTYRRFGLRRYLHQVQFLLLGDHERVWHADRCMIHSVGIDETHERYADLLVDAQPRDNFDFRPRSAEFSPSDMIGVKNDVELMGIAPMSSNMLPQYTTSLVRFR